MKKGDLIRFSSRYLSTISDPNIRLYNSKKVYKVKEIIDHITVLTEYGPRSAIYDVSMVKLS